MNYSWLNQVMAIPQHDVLAGDSRTFACLYAYGFGQVDAQMR